MDRYSDAAVILPDPSDFTEEVDIEAIAVNEPPKVESTKDSENNPWTDYLSKGYHQRITEAERAKRMESIEEVKQYIPKTGFFPAYIQARLPQTDGPVIFHLSAALVLAGHLLNRKAVLRQESRIIRPQIWAANIGASSIVRKSTSKDMMVKYVQNDPQYATTMLASSAFSMEGMYKGLGMLLDNKNEIVANCEHCEQKEKLAETTGEDCTQGIGVFCIDEMGSWLKALESGGDRSSGKTIVTEWFDYAGTYWHKVTAHNGIYFIYRPFISILGCSTVEWLNEHATDSDLRGGFFPRWLMFTTDKRDYTLPFTDSPTPQQAAAVDSEVARLKGIREEFALSPEAINIYWDWHKGCEQLSINLRKFEEI
jgi:hypothetical protein